MLVLLVWGFILPPIGKIDQSVIKAVGEIVVLIVVAQIPTTIEAFKDGGSVKISKGDASLEISKNENDEN